MNTDGTPQSRAKRVASASTSRLKTQVGRDLAASFKANIPKNDDVIRQALSEVLTPYGGDIEQMKADVSNIVVTAEARAHAIYVDAQRLAVTTALRSVLQRAIPPGASATEAVELIAAQGASLDEFFLSVAQGRKSRAGVAMETFFDTLFRGFGYPFEREHVVNGTPDFVFPSVAHFRAFPTDCVIFTCKRTLRERWRQITTEGARGQTLFLATLDLAVKAADLTEMLGQKINVVVPEQSRLKAYSSHLHVISIETFLREHLDAAMTRWRNRGIVV